MNKGTMVKGFNQWMDEYIQDPEGFLRKQDLIKNHLKEKASGESLTYGELCATTLIRCAADAKR